jgi:phi LC3 family holin
MNLILRLKNKVTLTALAAQTVALVYGILGIFGVVPAVGENRVLDLVYIFIECLTLMGILVDPTTKGLSDSSRAMTYRDPN